MVFRFRQVIQIGCFLCFFLPSYVVRAQFTENFSDGNFTGNPSWQGSTAEFAINGPLQLQLNNTITAASYLSAPFVSSSVSNYEWQFYIKQTFAPSGSNFGRVYLVSDQPNLTEPLNGYYLQFGEALSSDAVELFRQTGSASVSICRATDGAISTGLTLRVRVLRNNAGLWQIMIDYTGGTNFLLEASGLDATYSSSNFIGIVCVYTASNATKFFFDDFYAGPEILDTTPPSILSVNTTSSTQLDLVFNEKVDGATSQHAGNYFVNNSVGVPLTATLQPDEKTVQLIFSESFPNATTSQLIVGGVQDLAGNSMTDVMKEFFFFQPAVPQWKDIVITEIFADPSPSVGLPDAEFVEIFNRSSSIFDLANWEISDGSSHGLLPSRIIFPGDYVILTSTASVSLFTSFGNELSVPNFPTLNNSGDALLLKDNVGSTVDNTTYTSGWYRDEDKTQGGYSLELIDPANPCAEEENWIATEATVGGTPGRQNSVFANKPDATGPRLHMAIPASSTEILIRFNERMHEELPALTDIIISPAIPVSLISFSDEKFRSVKLELGVPLEAGVKYSIQIQNMRDCNGNLVDSNFDELVFGLPRGANDLDIVINEILFNPRPTGVDFIEIYNNSSNFINLKGWQFANYQGGLITKAETITEEDFLLSPGQYIVFTEDKDIVKGEYISSVEENILEANDLPSLNDDEGTLALIDSTNRVIDFFNYSEDFHSIFIKDNEGVSLERISFNEITNNKANWRSASSTVGYATPGYVNSNVRGMDHRGKIVVTPEVFEPITGQPGFAQIQYNFEQGGFVANVKVLDTQGREIKRLVNNEILGTEGFFRWDGDTEDGTKARMGYYIVWIEVFNDKGHIETFRKRVVVASKNK